MWLRANASLAAFGWMPKRSVSSWAVVSSGSGTSTHTQPSSRASRPARSAGPGPLGHPGVTVDPHHADVRHEASVGAACGRRKEAHGIPLVTVGGRWHHHGMATQPLPGAGTGDDADTGLDPTDWAAFRTLAHRMLDDSLDHVAGRRDQPVWQPMPDAVRAAFDGPLPRAPEGLEAAYDDFRRTVVPYSMGNDHPRFWGWYMGAGNPVGNLADLLASVLNPNMGGADHAPVLVEQQVVRWCAEAAGYPTSASGLLVTGASEANLVGLAVARTVRIGPEVRTDGIPGGTRFGVYASTEVHSCHRKSVELLGLGESSLRTVPVRDDYTMDVEALAAAVAADRAAGIEPLAVVATVGTINTGSVDDLEAIADLAEREGLWLHVDGAIGGFLALSSHPDAVRGLERADSLALDLHKWMQAPIDVGLALVRDEAAHRATFSVVPQYL